jgi:hypothetical protein
MFRISKINKIYQQIGHFPFDVCRWTSLHQKLTLIHKNIRSVCNSHVQELTLILKIISQCDIKHILMSLIKTIMSDLKILTYIITSFTACPVRLAAILAIMSVSTLKTAIILYLLMKVHKVHVLDKNSQEQNGNINNGNKKKIFVPVCLYVEECY